MPTNDIAERLEMQHLVDKEESKDDDTEIGSWPNEIRKSKLCLYLGIILAVISAIFFSLVSVIVKYLVDMHPIQLSVCRLAGFLLPAIPIVIWRNECPFPRGKRLMLLLQSSFGAASVMLMFYAFRHMPLADASAIVFSAPVHVAIFARLFLKEPCGLFHVITIFLTLFGVVLISRPSFIFGSSFAVVDSDQQLVEIELWGLVAALLSTLINAYLIIAMRILKGIHYSVILLNFGAIAVVLSLTTSWCLDVLRWPQCGPERLLTVAVALLSFGGQVLLIIALQLEQAGPVSIARSSDILFSFIWQVLLFQEVPNRYSIAGVFLITTSVVLSGMRKWVLTLPESSMFRKMFCIF